VLGTHPVVLAVKVWSTVVVPEMVGFGAVSKAAETTVAVASLTLGTELKPD
jgi:hypothetical protein